LHRFIVIDDGNQPGRLAPGLIRRAHIA